MDELLGELLKQSPALFAIVATVWMGIKHVDKIDERAKENADKFVAAIKDIGEKCHEAHDKNAQMFYEQSCKGQEVLTQLAIHMSHFAETQKELNRTVMELRNK